MEPTPQADTARPYFSQWSGLLARLSPVLQDPAPAGLDGRLRALATEMVGLAQADPPQAQALLVHPELCATHPYSVAHSARVAATWALLGLHQQGATPESLVPPMAAALSMNIAMLSLQDSLTRQDGPLNPEQRLQIQQHPSQSARLLRAAGVTDPLWLAMVEQHHAEAGQAGVLPEARRLQMIDSYCACFGARARRAPLLADGALKRLFQQHPDDPTAKALAQAYGLYPPGTVVRLATLELAVVVRRGQADQAPIAVALQGANGEALPEPLRRDTGHPGQTVVAAVTPTLLRTPIPWVRLFTAF